MRSIQLNRRQLLRSASATAALGLGTTLMPFASLASQQSERKFLFVFCNGGWDPTTVFTPNLDDPAIWMDASQPMELNEPLALTTTRCRKGFLLAGAIEQR